MQYCSVAKSSTPRNGLFCNGRVALSFCRWGDITEVRCPGATLWTTAILSLLVRWIGYIAAVVTIAGQGGKLVCLQCPHQRRN